MGEGSTSDGGRNLRAIPQFAALRKEYLEGALARCRYFEQEVARLREGSPPDWQTLRGEMHKLRGSGGFYGFDPISTACAEVEAYIISLMEGEKSPDLAFVAGLVDLAIAAIHTAAERSS